MKNENKEMEYSQWKKQRNVWVGCGLAVLIVVLAVTAFYLLAEKRQRDAEVQAKIDKTAPSDTGRTVLYDGKSYEYRQELTNILFLGVDKEEEVKLQGTPGTAGQADCIMLMTLNEEEQTGSLLQISRDTMTEVDIYDVNGEYYTSVEAQVATQYAYGNGEKSSCWAMNKTVSELLNDLPIDAYISIRMDAIGTMTEALGGVTMTIPEDYTDIDPVFVKGSTVTLDSGLAEKYIRYRDTEITGSNDNRMQRQVEFITALMAAVKNSVRGEESYYDRFSSYLMPYMVTDMDARQVDTFANFEFNAAETKYLPGEMKKGEEHDEFYVDKEKLQKELIETFYRLEN